MPNDTTRDQRIGISNRELAEQEQRERSEHPPIDIPSETDTDTLGETVDQTSRKSGSRSTAQKETEARHVEEPAPSSRKVDGAFGKEPTEAVEEKS